MLKNFSTFMFKIMGWKTTGEFPQHIKRGILVAAPHTSNWDYIFAMAFFYLLKIPFKYTIKKEWLDRFYIGKLMKESGAIGVERNKKGNVVDALSQLFEEQEDLILVIQPEGTRNLRKVWKTGFYQTAMRANVPIILGYLDYKKKLAGIGPIFMPTGDYEKDMDILKDFYKDKNAKKPKNFCLDIYESSKEE